MGKTKIEWTHQEVEGREIPGYTFNPWIGCMKVSAGCKNCYAERQFKRKPRWADCWGPAKFTRRRRTSERYWEKPLAWNAQAAADGVARRVFCASLADVWEQHPDVTEWRRDLWGLVERTPALDWLLLTKRDLNIYNLVPSSWLERGGWPANAWMGVTVECNQTVGRIYQLQDCPSPVRFVSFEPLLEKIILTEKMARMTDWFIVGSESGPKRRPARLSWVQHLKRYRRFERPFFFVKQLEIDGRLSRNPDEWPRDLRYQETPPPRRV